MIFLKVFWCLEISCCCNMGFIVEVFYVCDFIELSNYYFFYVIVMFFFGVLRIEDVYEIVYWFIVWCCLEGDFNLVYVFLFIIGDENVYKWC